LAICFIAPLSIGAEERKQVRKPEIARPAAPDYNVSLVADSILASYDFESGPQGWIDVDLTAQVDTFFHVADGAELDGGDSGGLVPLEGNQSLWCGQDVSLDPRFCGYVALPGYGNNWYQTFESKMFVADSLELSYLIFWDSEMGYDQTFVEYLTADGVTWQPLQAVNGGVGHYDGVTGGSSGTMETSLAIPGPGGSPFDSTRIRFRFTSDEMWSDQDGLGNTDGAVIIDNIVVMSLFGDTLNYEDFEDEAPGAKVTTDGAWRSNVRPAYGSFAALHPGISVLQEGLPANTTNLWGFFDDPSSTNFACGGFPSQGAVPYHTNPTYDAPQGMYMWNEIWSPLIPATATADSFELSFSVYVDLPLDNLVFYTWHVRSWQSGCPGPWQDRNFVYPPSGEDAKNWYTHTEDISDLLESNVSHIQIALGAVDMCQVWCGFYGTGECHSHAPLFDDVVVVGKGGIPTGVDATPHFTTYLGSNYPNPFNPVTTIRYGLKQKGHVSLKIYDVDGRRVRTLVDEVQGAAPERTIQWDGRNDAGRPVSSGVYFYRLVTSGFAESRKLVILK
jgi:hypothetical protein